MAAVLEAALRPLPAGRGRGGRGCRSALYDWMWRHHDALAAELHLPRTPNWSALAERFGAMGATDGDGKPPTPEVVRRTWRKVRQAKVGRASPGTVVHPIPSEPATPTATFVVPTSVAPGPQGGPGTPDERPAYRFARGTSAKGWVPGSGKAEE